MGTLTEAFAPLIETIVDQVTLKVFEAFKSYIPPHYGPDKALSQKETAEMLHLTPKGLRDKLKLKQVPPPFTGEGEYPMWSLRTIEKYMRGEWQKEIDAPAGGSKKSGRRAA